MTEYKIKAWVQSGPRDQTNCLGKWGSREFVVQADSYDEALAKVSGLAKPLGYGGIIEDKNNGSN